MLIKTEAQAAQLLKRPGNPAARPHYRRTVGDQRQALAEWLGCGVVSPSEAAQLVAVVRRGGSSGARAGETRDSAYGPRRRVGHELLGVAGGAHGVRTSRCDPGERQSFLPRPRIGFYPQEFPDESTVSAGARR